MEACYGNNYSLSNHFIFKNKMIKIAKGAQRKIQDYKLSRRYFRLHEQCLIILLWEVNLWN